MQIYMSSEYRFHIVYASIAYKTHEAHVRSLYVMGHIPLQIRATCNKYHAYMLHTGRIVECSGFTIKWSDWRYMHVCAWRMGAATKPSQARDRLPA